MTWVHVPAVDSVTGQSNIDYYCGIYHRQSDMLDQCVPGMFLEGRSTWVRLNDNLAGWLACKLDSYKVTNKRCKDADFYFVGEGLDVWIDDPKVAMLFKLTYGGPRITP
jgi:hypothetical protein